MRDPDHTADPGSILTQLALVAATLVVVFVVVVTVALS